MPFVNVPDKVGVSRSTDGCKGDSKYSFEHVLELETLIFHKDSTHVKNEAVYQIGLHLREAESQPGQYPIFSALLDRTLHLSTIGIVNYCLISKGENRSNIGHSLHY